MKHSSSDEEGLTLEMREAVEIATAQARRSIGMSDGVTPGMESNVGGRTDPVDPEDACQMHDGRCSEGEAGPQDLPGVVARIDSNIASIAESLRAMVAADRAKQERDDRLFDMAISLVKSLLKGAIPADAEIDLFSDDAGKEDDDSTDKGN